MRETSDGSFGTRATRPATHATASAASGSLAPAAPPPTRARPSESVPEPMARAANARATVAATSLAVRDAGGGAISSATSSSGDPSADQGRMGTERGTSSVSGLEGEGPRDDGGEVSSSAPSGVATRVGTTGEAARGATGGSARGATGGGSAVTTDSLTDEPVASSAKYFALQDPSQK